VVDAQLVRVALVFADVLSRRYVVASRHVALGAKVIGAGWCGGDERDDEDERREKAQKAEPPEVSTCDVHLRLSFHREVAALAATSHPIRVSSV
jgi:hypothetical protein